MAKNNARWSPCTSAEPWTVLAELSDGRLYDGSTHAGNASHVLAALVFIGGAAMLFTEDASGRITRLRIPGPGSCA